MREKRRRHSQLDDYQKLKANARSYLNVYIKRGRVVKKSCSVCGNEKSEAHHEDYNKPLEVIWFCRKCHLNYHKQKKLEE
jgi:ribosomal protein S27AE